MKPTLTLALLTAALGLPVQPLLAADGVLIVERTTTDGVAQTNQIQIEPTRMRAEMTDPSGAQRVIVFDGTAQVMRIIDVAKKSYVEMTKADVDRMAGQMSGMMAMMQEKLKGLPPEQLAKMKAMMGGGAMGAMTASAPEYRKSGTDKVGKWTCDKYDGYQNNQKTSELCTVNPQALGLADADFQVTKQVAQFFAQLMPQNAEQFFSIGESTPQGFSGVPVRRSHSVGQRQVVTELTDVTRQTFADSIFAVPAGFQRQAFGPGQ